MPHILLAKGIADSNIDAVDSISTIEANIALGKYTSSTTPTLSAVNTAKDTLMDFLNDMNSDYQGNVAAFKAACGC
jgi:hypothetical protein